MTNIAVRAARDAGRVLLRYFDRVDSLNVTEKSRNDFVSEVDRAAESAIITTIGDHAGNDFQWVIDPLDGTTNYLHGFPQFSVSIALQHRGELQSAVVYDPLREELFTATKGDGAYLNERRIRVTGRKDLHGALLGTGIPFRDLTHVDAYLGMMKDLLSDTAGVRRRARRAARQGSRRDGLGYRRRQPLSRDGQRHRRRRPPAPVSGPYHPAPSGRELARLSVRRQPVDAKPAFSPRRIVRREDHAPCGRWLS